MDSPPALVIDRGICRLRRTDRIAKVPTDVAVAGKHTAIHDEHCTLGARFVPFAGWKMPVQFEGVVQEHHAVRQAAGLFDVSHMGRLTLSGDRAAEVVDGLVTNRILDLAPGQARYTVLCDEQGRIRDDLIVYRVESDRLLVVCNASNHERIRSAFEHAASTRCEFADVSEETGLIALQGPASFDVLAAAHAAPALRELDRFGVAKGTIEGIRVWAARTGYTGEDGVELGCSSTDAAAPWRHLYTVGKPLGLRPAGLGARDTLRLEARLLLYGNDMDETTHPYEAGLGWVVRLDKGPFVGREALAALKDEVLTRKLVGFEMTERGIARHGYAVVDAQSNPIGVVTSGSPSPTLGKNIGLAYVPPRLSAKGTTLHIDIRGRVRQAVVVKTPFYRRPKPPGPESA